MPGVPWCVWVKLDGCGGSPGDCTVLGGCVRVCVGTWLFWCDAVGVILEGCLQDLGCQLEGVRVSAGPVGCEAIRGLCLCLNGQGAPCHGPSGPGLLLTVPTPVPIMQQRRVSSA